MSAAVDYLESVQVVITPSAWIRTHPDFALGTDEASELLQQLDAAL